MNANNLLKCTAMVAAAFVLGTAMPAMAQEAQPSAVETEEQPAPSAEFVLSNLETISPFNIVYAISEYWTGGNKLQAAFWYYVWQIRTDAWINGDDSAQFAEARNSLNLEIGDTVNPWLAADPALLREVAQRALSYEAKLPLWEIKPRLLTQEQWETVISNSRTEYSESLRAIFEETSDEEIATIRRQNGLPVGTPPDLGEPLPEEWR